MNYYLSSYRLGNSIDVLTNFFHQSSSVFGYIPNALDSLKVTPRKREVHIDRDMSELRGIGIEPELLDLKDYFGQEERLQEALQRFGGIYISGGNTFILRQAMQLSGLDHLISSSLLRPHFIYSGYSAAACVLSPTLRAYAIVDDATDMPYAQIKEQIWEGLGILDFVFEPHYHSPDHPETTSVDREIQYCIDNKILFKAYKDGEVLVIS